tara:strand:- start:34 stop:288 length:255 start_codon:yes stop_codon:yes gene_type:complete
MCTIHDCATGETTERELTEEEYAQRDVNIALAEEQAAVMAQEQADAVAGRQKLLDLGLSEAEVNALVGPPPPDGALDVEASDPA